LSTRAKPVAKPGQQLCCLTIGFSSYLMTPEKGMKVIQLMQESIECERDLVRQSPEWQYQLRDRPRLELTIVKPEQVRQARDAGMPLGEQLVIGGPTR